MLYFPPVTGLREPFNGLSHLLGSYLSLAGMIYLVQQTWDQPSKRLSLAIYGASLTVMMVSSSAYHSLNRIAEHVRRLRAIDHAAIFVLIAGTATPIAYNLFDGFYREPYLMINWGIALVGMIYKIFFRDDSDWFIVSVYFAAGWMSLLGLPEFVRVLPFPAIAWLFAGGLIYSIGAILSAFKKPDFFPGVFGHHEVWHLSVAAAALCHYYVIVKYVL